MQSGISASQALRQAFTTLITPPASGSAPPHRGLLAVIEQESIVPSSPIPQTSSSSTFTDDLSQLENLLSPTAAAYIILREDHPSSQGKAQCIAITYVPDAAPVRQKMLTASTRLTLVRELGTEHFSNTLFATTKDELTASGWKKTVEHGTLAAPLTEEERSLEDIKEAEASESMGTGARRGGHVVAGGVSMPVSGEAVDALKRIGDSGLVVLNLDLATETISLVSTHSASDATPATISNLVSATNPTYSFYTYAPSSAVLFIYCCPAGRSVKERMTYAASSRSVPVMAQKEAGLQVTHKLEVSGVDELDQASILNEIDPGRGTGASGSMGTGGFARPKRPGKR